MNTRRSGYFLALLVLVVSSAAAGAAGISINGVAAPEDVVAHDLTIGSNLTINLSSASPGTTPLLTGTGTVTLGGTLTVNATGAPFPSGRTYLIIENDGTDPIVGTFAGLPEGSIITSGGQIFRISYTGGSGNDVVLTALAAAPTVPALDGRALVLLTVLMVAAAAHALRG